MGASLDYVVFHGGHKGTIQKEFDEMANQSRYEDGHSYSGAIGMLYGDIDWRDQEFKSKREAIDYLSDTHEKWGGPMAVSYRDPETPAPHTKYWVIGGWCSS